MNTIIEKLNRYANMQAAIDLINIEFDELRSNVLIPPEVQAVLETIEAERADIEVERATALEAANEGMNKLQAEIKSDVVNHGSTVKSEHVQAVFVRPRVTWDTKRLDGFAAAHPEIEQFRNVGNPSVRLRWVG